MRVTVNVLLRNPQTGEVTFIEAGSDAPEWAADMLGEHAVDDKAEPAKPRAKVARGRVKVDDN